MAGPAIKTYEPQVGAATGSSAVLPTRRPTDMFTRQSSTGGLDDLGRGLEQVARVVGEREEEQARAWSADVLAQTRLEWTQALLDRQAQAQPGAPDFTPTFLEDFRKKRDGILEKAPSDRARLYMEQRLGEIEVQLGTHAMTFEAQARIDYRNDQFMSAADNLAKLMNTDPSQYAVGMAELKTTVDSSAMPPVVKSAMWQKIVDKVSTASVAAQIQKSPTAFLQSIGFWGEGNVPGGGKTRGTAGDLKGVTGNTAFDALPFEKRVSVFESAVRMKSQIDADAEHAATKNRELAAQEGMKNMWSLLFAPGGSKLTRDVVEGYRPVLKENDYKAMLTALRAGPEQRTDPATYNRLEGLIYARRFDEASNFAYAQHRAGMLSNETLGTALSRIETMSSSSGPRTQYERDRKWIHDTMNPGDLVPDPIGRQRMGDALQVFDDWRVANPKASDTDVRKRAVEVLDQFRFLNLSDTVLALPTPRGINLRRDPNPEVINSEVAAAATTLQKRLADGKIKQQEYDEGMEILNRWRKAAARK